VSSPFEHLTRRPQGGGQHEQLYVIVGFTHEGIFVCTKGALRKFAGEDWFYLFVSAKRSIEEWDDAPPVSGVRTLGNCPAEGR
jgi:hypothetical protein